MIILLDKDISLNNYNWLKFFENLMINYIKNRFLLNE